MQKDVEVGLAGSLTMTILVVAVVFLLRSFYKRYTNAANKKDDLN
mgnify:CR=1 FL=1|jgi:hypothetical protein